MPFPPLKFEKDNLKLLDQRKLPHREIWRTCRNSRDVHWSIRHMVVRGAPAIGVVAGYGLYLGMKNFRGDTRGFFKKMEREAKFLKTARPTAVNLANVIDHIYATVIARRAVGPTKQSQTGIASLSPSLTARRAGGTSSARNDRAVADLKKCVLQEAKKVHRDDDVLCRKIGRHGSALFRSGDRVLTHCNAGGLATSGYGTALGVLYSVKSSGKKISVYADETRPLLQGARLTAWELTKSGIPCTLLCDNFAASMMQAGKIDRIIVGADRIAANGDTANKIGTYNLAVLAEAHGIPFYIAAPGTTFDFHIKNGKQIPIENRHEREVTEGFGKRIAPYGVRVENPAFDVTPYRLITAFITEAGVLKPPFKKSFRKLKCNPSSNS
ncbi:MAG: S-methyl-5-thioribose-1-phosphate isomerase [Candidatus Omnitrophica bacterium]|nr:S-methyl-5-thioribose-1-phosphate isomerase [Candidatus Omnitrophota bacterium]